MSLEQLQLDITGRLDSLPGFLYVPVKSIRPRSEAEALLIQTEIDKTLAGLEQKNGKGGATAIVQMPTLDVENPDIPGPDLVVTTVVRVLENPQINMGDAGTQSSAETLGLLGLAGLHQWDPGDGNPLFARGRAMEPNLDFDGLVGYDILIQCRLGIQPEASVPEPALTLYSGTAALSCPLSGAEIRYTLDGSFPGPAATLYASPFSVGAAKLLRAAAYKDGLLPSHITQQSIS